MSTSEIHDTHTPEPSAPRKRRGFLGPLLFFALGVLSAYGYFHWFASRGPKEMNMSSGTAMQVSAPEKKQPKILYYVDPMNPSNKTDKPGKAPCGMDMVPVYEEEQQAGSDVPQGAVRISPEKQQMIGVKLGEAAEMEISKTIRVVGRAAFDETRVAHVHTKIPGWVDKVYVDFIGKLVKKGQPLLSIYSPDLVSTQQELLIAKKSGDILKNSEFGDIGANSGSLYKATRDRLKYWDISDSQIDRIERQGTPLKALTLYSALDGFVVARNVFAGQQVSPETDLFVVADLSTVWILAEVYEYEIPAVTLGQKASVTFPSFPGKTFTGKITYISPEMDPKTRTLKIRVELVNPDFKIKPDMYADVGLKLDYGKKLSIPQEAVLDSGADQTVFVALDGGYFEPRKVTLGPGVDGRMIVLGGLKPGDRVVTSANFLIDSESQLKSAAGGMGEGRKTEDGGRMTEDGGQRTEAGGRKTDGGRPEHSGHTQ
jgi:multidrug efflux pump subunit AcrA (membrane-fusion protein)